MIRLCIRRFVNGEITYGGTQYVHLLAATFVFHATGVAAVKFAKFDLIKHMMEVKVQAPNALSPSFSFPLEYLAGCMHWRNDTLNSYMYASWLHPYSQMVMSGIKSYFGTTFIDDEDFQNCFYVWEHLASLLCNYYKCHTFDYDWFPIGGFVNKRISILRGEEDYYTDFFNSASQQKENWKPIKCGLFGGKYEDYFETYNTAEEFYRNNRNF